MSFVIKPKWGRDNYGPTVESWEVGWVKSDGDFEVVRQTERLEEAAILCNYLNGGSLPKDENAIEHVDDWFSGVKMHQYHHNL